MISDMHSEEKLCTTGGTPKRQFIVHAVTLTCQIWQRASFTSCCELLDVSRENNTLAGDRDCHVTRALVRFVPSLASWINAT